MPFQKMQLLFNFRPSAVILPHGRVRRAVVGCCGGQLAQQIAVVQVSAVDAERLHNGLAEVLAQLLVMGMHRRIPLVVDLHAFENPHRMILLNALGHCLWGVLLPQRLETHSTAVMGQFDGRVFVVGIEVHLIAHLAQDVGQISGRLAAQNGKINILAHDVIPGRFSGFLGQIEVTRHPVGILFVYHRKPLLPAQFIRSVLQGTIGLFAVVVPLAIHKRHRVDDEVIVAAIGVQVGGYQHLKPITPHPLGQFHPDGVTLLRRDFAGAETLVGVEGHRTPGLAELLFGQLHLLAGNLWDTVDTADKELTFPSGLGVVGGILQHVAQIVLARRQTGQVRQAGLFFISGIAYDRIQTPFHGPDLGDSHLIPPSAAL